MAQKNGKINGVQRTNGCREEEAEEDEKRREFRNRAKFRSHAWKILHYTKNSCLLLFLKNREHQKIKNKKL